MMVKVPVITKKEYQVTLEPYLNLIWVHCTFLHFNAASLRQFTKDWESFTGLSGQDLYVLRDPVINKPTIPFISKFGFVKQRDLVDKQGNPKEIWKRDKLWVDS